MSKLILKIPATYEEETLTIKCLQLSASGLTVEDAYKDLIKSSKELYASLKPGKVKLEGEQYYIIVPHDEKVYNKILDLEPLPDEAERRRRQNSHLKEASPEDVIKYGY